MSCKNSNRSQLCCRVLKSERERKREKKMGKGNDGCGMKQAKKSASKTGTQFRIEQLIVLKTAADHVILYS